MDKVEVSTTLVIELKLGQIKIKMTRPMNFKVIVKYLSFSSLISWAYSLKHIFFIGTAKTKPNKNMVIPPPEVIALIPFIKYLLPNNYMEKFKANAKIYIMQIVKIWTVFNLPTNWYTVTSTVNAHYTLTIIVTESRAEVLEKLLLNAELQKM